MVYCVAALSSIEPELASSGVPLYGVLHETLGAEEFRHGITLLIVLPSQVPRRVSNHLNVCYRGPGFLAVV